MWFAFPCGQNSDLREALGMRFPSRLDLIICSNRQLFCLWNELEDTKGPVGQRPL